MMTRRFTATAAALGALALVSAPLANAAPVPNVDPNLSRAVPGTTCNVGQLRAAIDRGSPGLSKKLEDAAGGPKAFADAATADPATRQLRIAALAFTSSGTGFSLLGDQAGVQRAVTSAYAACGGGSAKK